MLHDVAERRDVLPDAAPARARKASFEVHNSPLSENACLGFEYGYSITESDALVIWEAQFGDFANGAQVIIDQFIASGRAKWGQTSRLTLFLPHGYEGNGPEHSSARLERFLQLAADDNLRIANVTTPAQHYHLVRGRPRPERRPLVVMTPKGLLRLSDAASTLDDLLDPAGFQPVIDDATERTGARTSSACPVLRQAVLRPPAPPRACQGGRGRRSRASSSSTRSRRREVARAAAGYPSSTTIVWAQEEPRNMGAWRSLRHRLEEAIPEGVEVIVRGPAVARQPVRGVPARPRTGAGPDRPLGARSPTRRLNAR